MKINIFFIALLVTLVTNIFVSCTDPISPEPTPNITVINPDNPVISQAIQDNEALSFIFNTAVNPEFVNNFTFVVKNFYNNQDSCTVVGIKTITNGGKTITFRPSSNYQCGSEVRVILDGITSTAGITMSKKQFIYTVATEPIVYLNFISSTPAHNATDISVGSTIMFRFNESIASGNVNVKVNNQYVTGLDSISDNQLIFKSHTNLPSDAHIIATTSNILSASGHTLKNEITTEFDVEHITRFVIEDGNYPNGVYTDKQNRVYFTSYTLPNATGFISRYSSNGMLDTTISLGFLSDISLIGSIDITDNGNIYIAFLESRLGNKGVVVAEFDNDFNYLNNYRVHEYGLGAYIVAAGNGVYHVGAENNKAYLTNVLTGYSVQLSFGAFDIIFDSNQNALIINGGDNNGAFTTAAYDLNLNEIWRSSIYLFGNSGVYLSAALAQNRAGNYFSFGTMTNFITVKPMRFEYSPSGVLIDSLDLGSGNIRDAKPCPINDVVVVQYDLPFGSRVAVLVTNEYELYFAAGSGIVKFYNIRTKNEVFF